MDMMQMRRMVMGQMASGARFEKGTFTIPSNFSGNQYTINFSRSYSKYMIIIEATDSSKTEIINTGYGGNRAFAFIGFYPMLEINNASDEYNVTGQTLNPSSGVISGGSFKTATLTDSSFSNTAVALSSAGSYYFHKGLSYNYYVVEIK